MSWEYKTKSLMKAMHTLDNMAVGRDKDKDRHGVENLHMDSYGLLFVWLIWASSIQLLVFFLLKSIALTFIQRKREREIQPSRS
jgi:hypothetical protein